MVVSDDMQSKTKLMLKLPKTCMPHFKSNIWITEICVDLVMVKHVHMNASSYPYSLWASISRLVKDHCGQVPKYWKLQSCSKYMASNQSKSDIGFSLKKIKIKKEERKKERKKEEEKTKIS